MNMQEGCLSGSTVAARLVSVRTLNDAAAAGSVGLGLWHGV